MCRIKGKDNKNNNELKLLNEVVSLILRNGKKKVEKFYISYIG